MPNKPQTLKGFRDFLPNQMYIRNRVIDTLRRVFESYGFAPLQTPTLEYADVLTGKYGEEADKLLYLFEDRGGRQIGLNYDLTVPTARVMSQYTDLPLPFKRYQIQPSYRAENPQRGRYRQFTQCDIDILGSSSPLADAEILAVINDSLIALGFPDFTIRINSRQLLNRLLDQAQVPQDLIGSALQAIDKLDKKSVADVRQELKDRGLDPDAIDRLFTSLENLQLKDDPQLQQVIDYAQSLGVKNLKFDAFLVRGLDYYTGPIFETVVEKPKIGSITGGGRYDKLIQQLGGPDLPATGTTIGLDRLCDVIEELALWPELQTTTQVLVANFPGQEKTSLELAQQLRQAGTNAEVYLDSQAKLDKQFKYADKKGLPFVAIIGEKEAQDGTVTLKTMATRTQESLTVPDLLQRLKPKT